MREPIGVPRTVFNANAGASLWPAAGASDESRKARPGPRPRVPRAAPGPGHAFPGAAPVPSHVTTPRDSRPSGGRDRRMQARLGLQVRDFFQVDAESFRTPIGVRPGPTFPAGAQRRAGIQPPAVAPMSALTEPDFKVQVKASQGGARNR